MKNILIFFAFLLTLMLGCKQNGMPTQPIPDEVKVPIYTNKNDYSIQALEPFFITGDTITKPVKADLNLEWVENIDLKSLSEKPTHEFNYIAIGGGLTAGWRDGGLYRESQQTAFPNLIAHQMGLRNFKLPLFSIGKGNGTGYKVFNQKTRIWDYVGNNVAIEQKSPIKLEKYLSEVNNWGMPKMALFHESYSPAELLNKDNDAYYRNKRFMVHVERYLSPEKEEQVSYKDLFYNKTKAIDFFSLEIGIEDLVHPYLNRYPNFLPDITLVDAFKNYNELINSGIKGVICTVPDILATPYFYIYTINDFSYLKVEDTNAYRRTLLNRKIRELAEEKKLALVDLESLYKKVIAGEYISDDGLRIDPSFPTGNFFSQDAMYPSAVGQAVIANEFIKAIGSVLKCMMSFEKRSNEA